MLMLLPLLAVLLLMVLSAASGKSHVLQLGSYSFACSNRSHFQRLQPGPPPGCLPCTLTLCLRLSLSSSCRATVTARACRWCRWAQSVEPGPERELLLLEGLPLARFQEGLPLSRLHQCRLLLPLRRPQRRGQDIRSMDHHGRSALGRGLPHQGLPLPAPLHF